MSLNIGEKMALGYGVLLVFLVALGIVVGDRPEGFRHHW